MKQTKKEMLLGIENKVAKSKFIANNTLQVEYLDGRKAIRLHTTDIVTEKDGVITLNSGGWKTATTKDRINGYSWENGLRKWPYISQRNHQWFVGEGIFYDGIQFKDGVQISPVKVDDELKRKKMLEKIKKYCNLLTEDKLPMPGNGDCWYCLMTDTKTGKSLGDSSGNYDHLLQHMKERYIFGSILVNAMREAGYSDSQIGVHYHMKMVDTFKRTLRKYLVKRLIK